MKKPSPSSTPPAPPAPVDEALPPAPPPPDEPPAPPPPDEPPAPPAPVDEALAAFAADFLADLPPQASSGSYGATCRDRWSDQSFPIADGEHAGPDGWMFAFVQGKFVGARLAPPADLTSAS